MASWIGPWELSLLPLYAGGIVVTIFYLLALQHALERCSCANRTMTPGLVWLLLVPLFQEVWAFLVVIALGRSLGNEFRSRGLAAPSRPGQSLGLAMAAVGASGYVLGLGLYTIAVVELVRGDGLSSGWLSLGSVVLLLVLARLVLLIIYWVTIHNYSQRLAPLPYWSGPTQLQSGPPGAYCARCGVRMPAGRFCPNCGAFQHPSSSAERF